MSEQGGAPAPGGEATGEGGGEQTGLGLYDLSSAPEELRPFLEQELKKYDGNVTKKFQEHADFRKRFEPYQEVDFGDVPPDELSELIQFRQVLQDPEQLTEWLGAINESLGINQGPQTPEDWYALGEQNGWIDDEGNVGESEQVPAWAQQLVERVDQLDGGLKEFQGKTEGEKAAAQQADAFRNRLAELEIPDADKATVIRNAKLFLEGEDPIGEAWNDLRQQRGQAEGDLVENRLENQDGGGLPQGQVNGAAEHLSFGDDRLKAAALARMKQGG